MALKLKSIAKINFGLRILNKRPDGMHNLHTLFLPLNNLYDELTFDKSNETSFISNIDSLIYDNNNLIFKAHKLLENESGLNLPVRIKLEKNIPIGGGLGGGSSNAATTLIALNKLFELNVSPERLKELALSLGADVPFFLFGKPAIGTSLGEVLQPFPFPDEFTIAIVNPNIHVSTAEAFAKIIPNNKLLPFENIFYNDKIDFDFCGKEIVNDFEVSVFAEHSEIENIKSEFYSAGAEFALMSGTGSTVYGFFSDKQKAENSLKRFPDNYFTATN